MTELHTVFAAIHVKTFIVGGPFWLTWDHTVDTVSVFTPLAIVLST